jgi:hypothetical protein
MSIQHASQSNAMRNTRSQKPDRRKLPGAWDSIHESHPGLRDTLGELHVLMSTCQVPLNCQAVTCRSRSQRGDFRHGYQKGKKTRETLGLPRQIVHQSWLGVFFEPVYDLI